MKRIGLGRFAIWGAVGFGLGGAIASTTGDLLIVGFVIQGALGGAILGLAMEAWGRTAVMALACSFGFLVGYYLAFFVVLNLFEIPFSRLFIGAYGGGAGGAMLGLSLAGRGKSLGTNVLVLAIAGALGFGLGMELIGIGVASGWNPLRAQIAPELWRAVWGTTLFALEGIIGGLFLGTALWLLERRPMLASEYGLDE
jgi:hypothetical protein